MGLPSNWSKGIMKTPEEMGRSYRVSHHIISNLSIFSLLSPHTNQKDVHLETCIYTHFWNNVYHTTRLIYFPRHYILCLKLLIFFHKSVCQMLFFFTFCSKRSYPLYFICSMKKLISIHPQETNAKMGRWWNLSKTIIVFAYMEHGRNLIVNIIAFKITFLSFCP